jgi:hypothetical protein
MNWFDTAALRSAMGPERRLPLEAVRFALAHSAVSSAIIGFADVRQIDEAVEALRPDAPIDWSTLIR